MPLHPPNDQYWVWGMHPLGKLDLNLCCQCPSFIFHLTFLSWTYLQAMFCNPLLGWTALLATWRFLAKLVDTFLPPSFSFFELWALHLGIWEVYCNGILDRYPTYHPWTMQRSQHWLELSIVGYSCCHLRVGCRDRWHSHLFGQVENYLFSLLVWHFYYHMLVDKVLAISHFTTSY